MDPAKIPPEALEGLMKKAFMDETLSPELFWDALLNAHIYIPLAKGDMLAEVERRHADESANEDAEERRYPMLLGEDEDGTEVVWFFTSPAAMTTYMEMEYPYLELPAPNAFTKILKTEHEVLLIGPESLTLSLHPDLISGLAAGRIPEYEPTGGEETKTLEAKDLKVQVKAPEEDTAYLEKKFVPLFETLPDVLEAKFVQVTDPSGSRLLLGVRLEKESREILKSLVQRIAAVAEGTLPKGKTMDITFMSGSLKEAFEKWGKIVYQKK